MPSLHPENHGDVSKKAPSQVLIYKTVQDGISDHSGFDIEASYHDDPRSYHDDPRSHHDDPTRAAARRPQRPLLGSGGNGSGSRGNREFTLILILSTIMLKGNLRPLPVK